MEEGGGGIASFPVVLNPPSKHSHFALCNSSEIAKKRVPDVIASHYGRRIILRLLNFQTPTTSSKNP